MQQIVFDIGCNMHAMDFQHIGYPLVEIEHGGDCRTQNAAHEQAAPEVAPLIPIQPAVRLPDIGEYIPNRLDPAYLPQQQDQKPS